MADKQFHIIVFNDKKEKSQSYEATINHSDGGIDSHFTINACGYGANEQEAIMNLKIVLVNIKKLIDHSL